MSTTQLRKAVSADAINIDEHEAALRYGPSVHWFRRARWEGGGPRFIKLAGKVLYPVKELEDFFNSQIVSSTSEY